MTARKQTRKRATKKAANAVRVGKWQMPDCVEFSLGEVVYQGEYKAHITGIVFTPMGHLYLIRFQDGEGSEIKAYGFELNREPTF